MRHKQYFLAIYIRFEFWLLYHILIQKYIVAKIQNICDELINTVCVSFYVVYIVFLLLVF